MVIHRDQCRADARDVLDEFEAWLLRERSTQEGTAAAYTARVAGFVEWLPAPVDQLSIWRCGRRVFVWFSAGVSADEHQ